MPVPLNRRQLLAAELRRGRDTQPLVQSTPPELEAPVSKRDKPPSQVPQQPEPRRPRK
jgi:hypothetical protein